MSVVSLLGVNVLNNPAKFGDPYEFEITFECLEALQKGKFYSAPLGIVFASIFTITNLLVHHRSRMEIDLCWFRHVVCLHLLKFCLLQI